MITDNEGKQLRDLGKKCLGVAALIVIAFLVIRLFGYPLYGVWRQGLVGKAELKQAEWNRQITVREAEATKEASKSLADAEIERARGVAESNRIIGTSLKDNDAYLRYLWLQGLQDKDNNVIYIPTEAGMPILEAGKR